MAFFPSSPTLNQKAKVFNREWVYDGRRWKRVRLTAETITLTKLLDVDTSADKVWITNLSTEVV